MTKTKAPDRPARRKSRRPAKSAAKATPVAPDTPIADTPTPAAVAPAPAPVVPLRLVRVSRGGRAALFEGQVPGLPPNTTGREHDEYEDRRDAPTRGGGRGRGW